MAGKELVESAERLFDNPWFNDLPADRQHEFLKHYLAGKTPEFAKLPPERQDAFAWKVASRYGSREGGTPTTALSEYAGNAAGAIGCVATSLVQQPLHGISFVVLVSMFLVLRISRRPADKASVGEFGDVSLSLLQMYAWISGGRAYRNPAGKLVWAAPLDSTDSLQGAAKLIGGRIYFANAKEEFQFILEKKVEGRRTEQRYRDRNEASTDLDRIAQLLAQSKKPMTRTNPTPQEDGDKSHVVSTSRSWHPDQRQWSVIWVATLIALVLLITRPFADRDDYPTTYWLAFAVTVVGALLVWQIEGWKRPRA